WYELGMTYQQLKNQVQAIESFEIAISLKNNFEWALNSMAVSQALRGMYKEAIETLERTLGIDPHNEEALNLKNDFSKYVEDDSESQKEENE
ncbi:MAG: hypothetical protein U1C19_00495, partial [Methanobacteriaceae archaeon]|nr:hypothetical protein [Methanobacteriaceae archaeon]